jgi:hypothetical protein
MNCLLERLRLWAIRKLDGVDRRACLDFANERLMAIHGETVGSMARITERELPDGATVIGDQAVIDGCRILRTIYVAPWSRRIVISNNYWPCE